VTARGNGIVADAVVSPADQASEYLLMGLRISEGIDTARHAALAGHAIGDDKIAGLESLGLLRRDGLRLAATRSGRRVLNALIAELAV
jgi:oxygen-independent coproporphyrinogen-3 oxidase